MDGPQLELVCVRQTANEITYDLAKIRSDSKFAVNFRDHKFIFRLHFGTNIPVTRNVLRL